MDQHRVSCVHGDTVARGEPTSVQDPQNNHAPDGPLLLDYLLRPKSLSARRTRPVDRGHGARPLFRQPLFDPWGAGSEHILGCERPSNVSTGWYARVQFGNRPVSVLPPIGPILLPCIKARWAQARDVPRQEGGVAARMSRIRQRRPAVQGVDEVRRALRVAGRGEDRAAVCLEHGTASTGSWIPAAP